MKQQIFLFFTSLIIGFTGLTALPLFNYITDQYRIFHQDMDYKYEESETNVRFLHMLNVLQNSKKYDSFIFGSSRIGQWDISELGNSWYKLFYAGGVVKEHYRHIKILLKHKVAIKEIIVAIDHMDFSTKLHKKIEHNIIWKPFPSSVSETIQFYLSYLFKKPGERDIQIFAKKRKLVKNYDIKAVQQYKWNESIKKETLSKEHELKLLKEPPFAYSFNTKTDRMNQTIAEINSLVILCRNNNINLTLLINPFHYKNLLAMDLFRMEEYKQKLSNISPFYDFSGLNRITTDNQFWWDTSHYTAQVSNEMIKVIQNQKPIYPDFGMLVTKEKVDAHLKEVRSGILENFQGIVLYDENVVSDASMNSILYSSEKTGSHTVNAASGIYSLIACFPDSTSNPELSQIHNITLENKTIPSIFAHPPWKPEHFSKLSGDYNSIQFKDVKLSDNPIFKTSLALRAEPGKSDGVEFQLVVNDNTIASQVITGSSQMVNKWHPWTVRLEQFANQKIRLEFRVLKINHTWVDHAFWGNPLLLNP
ncbi:MAG: hypothetical protein GY699_23850 [Desulfobacteraceae bacterium]|nr:hypothetical protein [Desulfobacteraceae bacterium]